MSEVSVTLNVVADTLIVVAFLLMLAFTASYVSFFRWSKTKAGRAILFVFTSLLVVTLLSLLPRWVGQDYWLREWFRVFGWGFTVVAVLNLIRVLWYNFLLDKSPLSLEPRTHPIPTVDSDKNKEEL